MPHPITEPELIAYAMSEGARVTPAQLKRWRQAKLLPPVTRRGLGRGAGTETLYPLDAKRWVVDLANLVATDRNLKRAAWALWLKGYPVTEHAREWLLHLARVIEGVLYRLVRGDFDGSAKTRQLRQHPAVRAPLLALTSQPQDPASAREFERLLSEAMREAGLPIEASDLPFDFTDLSQQLQRLRNTLAAAPPDALLETRDHVLLLRFVLGVLVDKEEIPPTPLLFLCWFALMQTTEFGPQLLDGIQRAIKDRKVPQLLDEARPFVAALSAVLRRLQPLRSLV